MHLPETAVAAYPMSDHTTTQNNFSFTLTSLPTRNHALAEFSNTKDIWFS